MVVIGSGPGGYFSAILYAQRGYSVAIIEKRDLGGTCLNRGCIPTKALLHEASLWDAYGRSGLVKNREEGASYFKYAMERKNASVHQVVSGLQNLLSQDRITVFQGKASFINSRDIAIEREGKIVEKLEPDRILVATGAVSKEVTPLKTDGQWILGSDQVHDMTELPSALAIIGGGRRGVEFATFFNTLGVHVTLIEKEGSSL